MLCEDSRPVTSNVVDVRLFFVCLFVCLFIFVVLSVFLSGEPSSFALPRSARNANVIQIEACANGRFVAVLTSSAVYLFSAGLVSFVAARVVGSVRFVSVRRRCSGFVVRR